MTRSKAISAGLLAGALAGVVMTVGMLALMWAGIGTPLTLLGDRLTVFIKPGPFLALMGRVGGYNHLKQLGVGGIILGQILVGAVAGMIYGVIVRRREKEPPFLARFGLFFLLPLAGFLGLLWPVLGTSNRGYPIRPAALLAGLGLAIAFLVFERVFVLSFRYLTTDGVAPNELAYSPALGRRAFVLGGFGLLFAGGGAAIVRRLFQVATFSYDGTQYLGPAVEGTTPNDKFYCVTKNVIDPQVDESLWRLEVTGLVRQRQTYKIGRLRSFPAVEQETTLMCISNGIGAGLMSNAHWRGVPMRELLHAASPLSGAARVRLHGVDNYTDTFPLEKALQPTTLIAYEMNGEPLPHRHGFPARVIVPGYFGEKNVKWVTRIELAGPDAEGFYEKQGWGPNFVIPTRSRIDYPGDFGWFRLTSVGDGIRMKGVAFAGDRGISKVEVSSDDEKSWSAAQIDYPGTKLTWALWSYTWKAKGSGECRLAVRATDGTGAVQRFEPKRSPFSGATGLHKITVYIGG